MADVSEFGRFGGRPVRRFLLENRHGLRAGILDWGATLQSLSLPCGTERRELVLGLQDFDDYPTKAPYFGATCGRFGNRIANGRFELDGETHHLSRNENGRTHLHGGEDGSSKRIWSATSDDGSVTFSTHSPHGDQGYPGDLDLQCRYTLGDDDVLRIEMTAEASAATPVNLIHHSYWNLDGGGTIDGHSLELEADAYLPTDTDQIPTGEIRPVEGTDFDFRTSRRLDASGEPLVDFAFVLRQRPGIRRVAELTSSDGRIAMTLSANQPAVQVYTGFKMDFAGSDGRHFGPRSGICLETEAFPDAPNHPAFPSAILRPGETYRHVMEHALSWA